MKEIVRNVVKGEGLLMWFDSEALLRRLWRRGRHGMADD